MFQLVTVNKNGYVKHYFAETERLLSNIGGGNGSSNVSADYEVSSITGESTTDLSEKFTTFASEYLIDLNKERCGEDNGINYKAEMHKIPDLQGKFSEVVGQTNVDVPYYFTSSHIGSGSMITNSNGEFFQALSYEPFGGAEIIDVKQDSNYNENYRFGGFEKDLESGLLHAKNRNKDNHINFISSDDKWYLTPQEGCYVYAGNNPIMFKDPDGNQKVPYFFIGGPALTYGTAKVTAKTVELSDIQDLFTFGSAIVGIFTGKPPKTFSIEVNPKGGFKITSREATSDEFEAAYYGILIPFVSGSAVNKAEKAVRTVLSGAEAAKAAKNTTKMVEKDIDKVLGKGWHTNGEKDRYVESFKKELRGNTNADFYIDKDNGDIFLKGNNSNNWVKTGDNIKDFE